MQKSKRNDPDLMYLLARAQSLSGRPGDALVMLQRLAQMGIPTDADTNDDFRRVRALPAWTDAAAGLTLRASDAGPKPRAPDAEATPGATMDPNRDPRASADTPATSASRLRSDTRPEGSLSFTSAPFVAAGLAYDAVSRRFIVGDRRARKLVVVDEPSRHVANLVGAHSGGFADITALEIDRREGDLWVVSAAAGSSTLHKLQLISGRLMYSVAPPPESGAVEFVDVAVTPRSTVLALDVSGRRLFALAPNSRAFATIIALAVDDPVSIAPADEGIAYVAHAGGISRVDLAAHAIAAVTAPRTVDLGGLVRIRASRGSLVGIQRTGDGSDRVVRVNLANNGRRVGSIEVLEAPVPATSETTASIAGDVLYYLSSDGEEAVVRRVRLR
jgi:hypothetical protein